VTTDSIIEDEDSALEVEFTKLGVNSAATASEHRLLLLKNGTSKTDMALAGQAALITRELAAVKQGTHDTAPR